MNDKEIAAQLRKLLNAYPLGTMDWPLDVMTDAAEALELHDFHKGNWRPIDTAPTDGTEVWVFVQGAHDLSSFQCVCAYHPGTGWCADELRHITHWMPKPSPPSAENVQALVADIRSEPPISSPAGVLTAEKAIFDTLFDVLECHLPQEEIERLSRALLSLREKSNGGVIEETS